MKMVMIGGRERFQWIQIKKGKMEFSGPDHNPLCQWENGKRQLEAFHRQIKWSIILLYPLSRPTHPHSYLTRQGSGGNIVKEQDTASCVCPSVRLLACHQASPALGCRPFLKCLAQGSVLSIMRGLGWQMCYRCAPLKLINLCSPEKDYKKPWD